MKQVLVSALLLLGLAIAADRERASSEVTNHAVEGELAWVQAYSTAIGHAPSAQLTAEALSSIHFLRNKLQGRVLNARGLVRAENLPGVVAAAFAPDGELIDKDTFRPGLDAGEVTRLSEWSESFSTGALFVIVRRGSMTPEESEAAELEALFSRWGAEERPWESDGMSWALAAHRTEDGWEPVIEAASTSRGVMLSAPLSVGGSSSGGTASAVEREGLVLLGRAEEPHPVRIGVPLKDRAVDTYSLPQRGASELTWRGIALTEPARFSALLSAHEGSRFTSRGVRFQLLLNGALLEEVEFHMSAHERPTWLDWEVDVPMSEEPAELKLIMTPLKGSNAAQPQVGAPVLSFGA